MKCLLSFLKIIDLVWKLLVGDKHVHVYSVIYSLNDSHTHTARVQYKLQVRGPFEKFVGWRQCSAIMQREKVTVMPICSGGGNLAVA
jgi:hypothetical protein